MSVLVLRLAGPLQSWGGYRHGVNKEAATPTAAMPRKSGINGLIGAALGSRDLDDIGTRYRLHVRLDATNPVAEDFQTIGPLPGFRTTKEPGAATAAADRSLLVATAGTSKQMARQRDGGNFPTAITRKSYLAHSEFLVAVEVEHDALAREWMAALRDPTFMTYLGRKNCAPSFPFILGVWGDTVADLYAHLPCVAADYDPDAGPGSGLRGYTVDGDYDNHVERAHPTLYRPAAATRKDYLTWASTRLAR